MDIAQLKARLAELQESAQSIQNKADAEKRDLTAEEQAQLETIFADFDNTEADIKRRERLAQNDARINASNGRRTSPQQITNQGREEEEEEEEEPAPARRRSSGVFVPPSNQHERNRWGWKNFGDFAFAVKEASIGHGDPDPRLVNAATTYGSEGVGADGGFAVPPEFRAAIMKKVTGEDSLLARCDQTQTSGYSLTVPKDETTPWGTAGIQAFWDGEAATYTQKKPSLENTTIRTNKLTALVPVTDELLDDAPGMGSYIQGRAPTAIDFKVTDGIINGNGAGMPLGILNAGCTVSQAAEASQVAGTIHGLNIVKMWARMPAAWRSSAVWLVHPDVEPLLMTAGLQVGPAAAGAATGGQLIYMPPGGISAAPYGNLYGRPVLPFQSCQAPGTVGDIIFASMQQYCALLKAGGLRADQSIHLYFDQGITAFRFTFRMGGQPWWSSAIAAKNGSSTYGPFVTLAAR